MTMNLDELITQANGNGNGNGNHKKVFELAQPKSADEIARTAILQMMPKLRRECSKDRRLTKLVGAKWLFSQLTDLSFLHVYGGDGFGKIFISVKDLARIFGHDEQTISGWRDALIATGWVWFQKMSPKSCWGISGVTRQPELFGPGWEVARSMARASADHPNGVRIDNPNGSGGSEVNGNSADSNGKTGSVRIDNPNGSGQGPESFGSDTRTARVEDPNGSGQTPEGTGSQTRTARVPHPNGSGA